MRHFMRRERIENCWMHWKKYIELTFDFKDDLIVKIFIFEWQCRCLYRDTDGKFSKQHLQYHYRSQKRFIYSLLRNKFRKFVNKYVNKFVSRFILLFYVKTKSWIVTLFSFDLRNIVKQKSNSYVFLFELIE